MITAIDTLIRSIEKDIELTQKNFAEKLLGTDRQRKLLAEYRRFLTRALFHRHIHKFLVNGISGLRDDARAAQPSAPRGGEG